MIGGACLPALLALATPLNTRAPVEITSGALRKVKVSSTGSNHTDIRGVVFSRYAPVDLTEVGGVCCHVPLPLEP